MKAKTSKRKHSSGCNKHRLGLFFKTGQLFNDTVPGSNRLEAIIYDKLQSIPWSTYSVLYPTAYHRTHYMLPSCIFEFAAEAELDS